MEDLISWTEPGSYIINHVLVREVSENVKGRRKEWQQSSRGVGKRKCQHSFRKQRETQADRWTREDWPAYFQLSVKAHLAPTELICQRRERTGGTLQSLVCTAVAWPQTTQFHDQCITITEDSTTWWLSFHTRRCSSGHTDWKCPFDAWVWFEICMQFQLKGFEIGKKCSTCARFVIKIYWFESSV